MNYKKIEKQILSLEKGIPPLRKKLETLGILSSKDFMYHKEDKEEFLKFWKQHYIPLFSGLKKLIQKSHYRSFFIKINYDKLILQRYLVILYFNLLGELQETFKEHEEFIRILLDENFPLHAYNDFAHFIYQTKFINLLNTPALFMESAGFFSDPELQKFYSHDVKVHFSKKLSTDRHNIGYYIKYRINLLLLFISKYVGAIISKTRFSGREGGLITKYHLKLYLKKAEPGDIILTRGNWNASNFTIPGFWKHMALYVGTGEYIKKRNKKIANKYKLEDDTHYIVEATGNGIAIVPFFEFGTHHDYMGFVRTTFSKEKIKRSIVNALSHLGKEYDHLFNYLSDKNLVCSELVLKSYAPEFEGDEGIHVNLQKIGISLTFPPNAFITLLKGEMVKKHPALEPLYFIDSKEVTLETFEGTKESLLQTDLRPKLTFFLP